MSGGQGLSSWHTKLMAVPGPVLRAPSALPPHPTLDALLWLGLVKVGHPSTQLGHLSSMKGQVHPHIPSLSAFTLCPLLLSPFYI